MVGENFEIYTSEMAKNALKSFAMAGEKLKFTRKTYFWQGR